MQRVSILTVMLALAALAVAMPTASATCVTYKGTGVCADLGGSGTGPGVSPTGGDLCIDSYCPSLAPVPYDCVVTLSGRGAIDMSLCIGTPPLF